MKPLASASEASQRFEPLAGIWLRLLGPVLRLFVGNVRGVPGGHDKASAAEHLHLHLSLLSDAELGDYGLRREEIAEFVKSGPIERP